VPSVELSTIMEDQEVGSKGFTNAEVRRPSEVPKEYLPFTQTSLGIQNVSTLVKGQTFVKAPKPHDIRDINSDPKDMLK
jgi:hypothetical protein